MANDKDQQLDIERARELLSPYLDDQVTEAERALVEEAITTSAELRQEMEMLRQTVSLVSGLPQMPAPRPFTISEVDVKGTAPAKRKGFTLPFWLKSWATVAATLICVIAIGGFLLLRSGSNGFSPAAPAEIAMEESAPAQPTDTPVEVEQLESEAFREETVAEEEAPAEAPVEGEAMMAESAAEEEAPLAVPTEQEAALEAAPAPAEEEAAVEPAPAEPSPEEAPAPPVAEDEAENAVADEEAAEEEPAALAVEEGQTEANGGTARSDVAQSGEADLTLTVTPSPVGQAVEIEAEEETIEAGGAPASEGESSSDQDDAALQQKSEPAEETVLATSTATPPPSATATSAGTRVSAATSAVESTAQPTAAPEEGVSQTIPLRLILLAGSILLVGLIVVGLIAWLVILTRRQKD